MTVSQRYIVRISLEINDKYLVLWSEFHGSELVRFVHILGLAEVQKIILLKQVVLKCF